MGTRKLSPPTLSKILGCGILHVIPNSIVSKTLEAEFRNFVSNIIHSHTKTKIYFPIFYQTLGGGGGV